MRDADQTRTPRFDVRGDAFSRDEEEALDRRRKPNHIGVDEPLIGLALSGGGVRSATFCFGLLRALAKNKVLLKFDYLSTVSGGGYTGAAFGRLFKEHVKAGEVEEGVAYDSSELFWWLRRNGRYLLPAGMRDVMQTWAGQLRGFVATQFEVTMLFVLASCVIVVPHVVGYPWVDPDSSTSMLTRSLWWLLMTVSAWLALLMAFAYWWSRDRPVITIEEGAKSVEASKSKRPFAQIDFLISAAALLIAIGLIYLGHRAHHADGNTTLTVLGIITLAAPVSGFWLAFKPPRPAQDRVRFTMWLSTALKWMLGLGIIGAADLLTWFIADQAAIGSPHAPVLTSAGLAAMLVAVARFTLPLLHARTGKNSKAQLPLTWVANVCGVVLLVLLALFWLSATQYFIFFAQLWPVTPWIRALMVAVACGAYVVVTGGNLQLINLSSLHAFYRSRIARTYVSVGNAPDAPPPKRGPTALRATSPQPPVDKGFRFPSSPLGDHTSSVRKLTEMLDGDDVELYRYTPHAFGGPIHLINCCINQTVDDRTDTYNADRKGVYLTVSSLGMETGTKIAQHADATPSLSQSTLAKWIAISGAAAGSGMGSMTRTGIAALFFLSGLRLGYWWNHDVEENAHVLPAQQRSNFWWKRLGKSRAALQEMLAQFPGLQSPVWYLSDGGHFDNTGVYSLLKRRLKLIVLADCGADPHYAFADMENLIRKARVDMDTMIEFIDPQSLSTELGDLLQNHFGTPDTITPEPGDAHLLLARINYPDNHSGCLLVVKPRLRDGLPLDVAGYADRYPDFPQQSTAEQFFDEAQWESYCQLGEVLGKVIDSTMLKRLPGLAISGAPARTTLVAHNGKGVYGKATGSTSTNSPASGVRSHAQMAAYQTRRQRIGATLGTSLSLGVLATVLITAWQAWDSHVSGTMATAQVTDEQQRFIDTVQIDLESGVAYDPYMHARLYALLVQIDEATASSDLPRSMHRLAATLNTTCGRLGAAHPLFDRCLEDATSLRDATAKPSFWQTSLHDYQTRPKRASNHPAIAADMTAAMQKVCRRLEQPQHITVHAPADNGQTSWSQPVFLYSASGMQSEECAQLLVAWLPGQAGFNQTTPRALPVPVPLYGDANAIELWKPGAR